MPARRSRMAATRRAKAGARYMPNRCCLMVPPSVCSASAIPLQAISISAKRCRRNRAHPLPVPTGAPALKLNFGKAWAVMARLIYGVYAARTRHYNGGYSNSLSLSASMPLDLFGTRAHSVHTGYTVSHITGQGVAHRASASGTLLEQHNLNYGVNIGAARGGANGAFNLGYAGGVGRVDAGYSVGAGYQRASVNLGGGMVLHRGGLTLSQPLQDTIALVVAPGAAHVRLENQQGVRTDRRGYAVVPSLNPYRRNRIAL